MYPTGGQAGQVQRAAPMYRPEQMRAIPLLTEDEKKKYEDGLRQLWNVFENNPDGSTEKEAARKKILEFATVLGKKVRDRKTAGGQQQPGGMPGQQMVAGPQAGASGAAPMRMKPAAAGAAGEGQAAAHAAAAAGAPGPQQQGGQPQRLPEPLQRHLNGLTWRPPPNVPPDQTVKWQEDSKKMYTKCLVQVDGARTQTQKLDAMKKARDDNGQPFNAEELKLFNDKKHQYQRVMENAQQWMLNFRKQQDMLAAQGQAKAGPANAGPAQRPGPAQQPGLGDVKPQQRPGTALQDSQANINGAFDAAKKESVAAAARMAGVNGLGVTQQQAQPAGAGAANAQLSPAVTQAPAGLNAAAAAVKIEPGTQPPNQAHPPPVNTALAAAAAKAGMSSTGTPTQPQSARIQTPQNATAGQVTPYSHQKAIEVANQQRQNSASGALPGQPGQPGTASGTPSSGGGIGVIGSAAQHGHPHAHPNQQATVPTKMPINKNLPERATQPPQPAAVGGGIQPGRPTYTAGGGTTGVMGQPAVAKPPMIPMEGEGERVLNKKKLDELVRQVCGGTAEGQEGNMLSPEVEEVSPSSTPCATVFC